MSPLWWQDRAVSPGLHCLLAHVEDGAIGTAPWGWRMRVLEALGGLGACASWWAEGSIPPPHLQLTCEPHTWAEKP